MAAVTTEIPTPVMMAPCMRLMKVPIIIPMPAEVRKTRRRKPITATTVMLMPKTPVDEYNLSTGRKDYVGIARKITAMQAKTVAKGMEQLSNSYLRTCVHRSDTPHYLASLLWTNSIHGITTLKFSTKRG